MSVHRLASIGVAMGIAAWAACPANAVERQGDAPRLSGENAETGEGFSTPDELYARIDALIRQLGSDRYIERSEAERDLMTVGYEAFDQLKVAESDQDAEIAARARYLTGQLTIDWTLNQESPIVRQILADYDRISDEERLQRVRRLAALSAGESLSALCLIARFDDSDAVAMRAALSVINLSPHAIGDDQQEPLALIERSESILQHLGRSRRTSAEWLRTYAQELLNPAESADAWQEHVDAALAEVRQEHHAVFRFIAIDLLQHVADVYEQIGRDGELLELLVQMVDLDETGAAGVLRRIVERLVRTKNWAAIDQIVEQYGERFRDEPIVMYMLADARRQQGDEDEAVELAERAFKLSQVSYSRIAIASELDQRGLYDWAEREFREVLDQEPALSDAGLDAALKLTAMLYDVERYDAAAKLADGFIGRLKNEERDDEQDRFSLVGDEQIQRIADYLQTRADYYRACHAVQQQELVTARKYLEQALDHDPRDIDVLIALYRLPADDADARSDVLRRIEEEAQALDAEIRQQPGNATNYNNWAWLIANTRGDYDKAVRYAHRAVDNAQPGSLPGFLDTLGRAYYAKGDYENAVRHQRRAVELEPHTQQLRRQLDEFEEAMK